MERVEQRGEPSPRSIRTAAAAAAPIERNLEEEATAVAVDGAGGDAGGGCDGPVEEVGGESRAVSHGADTDLDSLSVQGKKRSSERTERKEVLEDRVFAGGTD